MRIALTGALALTLTLLLAGPAAARVDDPASALDARAESRLEAGLADLEGHRFDVLVVDSTPGGATRQAEAAFAERGLGPADGMIVVATGDREVGVHLGQGFAQRGVGGAAINQRVASDFVPHAQSGDYATASLQLARGLVAEAAGVSAPAGTPVRQEAPGFPWWLFALPLAAGGFMWLSRRSRKRRVTQDWQPRLEALKAQHERILNGALKLDEASALSRFHAGDTATTYAALGKRSGSILGEASQFGALLEEAESQLKGNQHARAEELLVQLEATGGPLEAEVAGALTALTAMADDPEEARGRIDEARARLASLPQARPEIPAMLETRLAEAEARLAEQDATTALIGAEQVHQALDKLEGKATEATPAIAWAQLPEATEAMALRINELEAAYANERDRAATFGLAGDPRLEGRLDAALRHLTTPPVDLGAAKGALQEAATALARYHDIVEAEAERVQTEPAAPLPNFGWGGGLGPIIMLNSLHRGGHHMGGGMSGGGSWGGGFGSSGGGSWGGGGSSGGGRW